jgi:hypothetical protein
MIGELLHRSHEKLLTLAHELDSADNANDYFVAANSMCSPELLTKRCSVDLEFLWRKTVIHHDDVFGGSKLRSNWGGNADNAGGEPPDKLLVKRPELPELLEGVTDVPDVRYTAQPRRHRG